MRILIYSPSYLPNIGGLENDVDVLALEYTKAGNVVTVVTLTHCSLEIERPFRIIRNPGWFNLIKLFLWCDVIHHPNVSLKGVWPLLFVHRPYFVSHHTTNYDINGNISLLGKLKYFISRYAKNTSCSSYVNDLLLKRGAVIHSPYNDKQFYIMPEIRKDRDLVFLGRLVSDKGCDLILEALALLKNKRILPNLTIVGDGPERQPLQRLCEKLRLREQVTFVGLKMDKDLRVLLNRHKILVAPSVWNEPFGKVALEGLACGCKVIVPDSGGFPEAAGPTGIFFQKGNIESLALKIQYTLETYDYSMKEDECQLIQQHLNKHKAEAIGKEYLIWIQTHLKTMLL